MIIFLYFHRLVSPTGFQMQYTLDIAAKDVFFRCSLIILGQEISLIPNFHLTYRFVIVSLSFLNWSSLLLERDWMLPSVIWKTRTGWLLTLLIAWIGCYIFYPIVVTFSKVPCIVVLLFLWHCIRHCSNPLLLAASLSSLPQLFSYFIRPPWFPLPRKCLHHKSFSCIQQNAWAIWLCMHNL